MASAEMASLEMVLGARARSLQARLEQAPARSSTADTQLGAGARSSRRIHLDAQGTAQGVGRGVARAQGARQTLGPRLVAAPRRSLWCHAQKDRARGARAPRRGSGLQPRERSHASQEWDVDRAEVQR